MRQNSTPFAGRPLYVSLFTNSTYQPDIEGELRRALLDEGVLSSLDIRSAEKSADLLLSGDIESLNLETSAFSARDKVKMYRVVLVVEAKVSDRKSGKVLWKAKETVREEYPANAEMALQRNARDAAVAAACREMAQHLLLQMNRAF